VSDGVGHKRGESQFSDEAGGILTAPGIGALGVAARGSTRRKPVVVNRD
jgi:hypothetical protein